MKKLHLYGCESCKLEFGVSTSYLQQEQIVCPVCNSAQTMVDYNQEVNYRLLRTLNEAEEVNLYRMFEQEFGRALSPFEAQMICEWNRKHSTDVIKLALREAVLRNVKKFRYIDKILLNWEQEGVTNVNEALEICKRHRICYKLDGEIQTAPREAVPEGLSYNWLEEDA